MEPVDFGPVRFIPGKNQGRYPYCHSVYLEGDGVLIDPGAGGSRLAELRDGPGVASVWLSHWHEDHIRNLNLFADRPLFVSAPDAAPLTDIECYLDSYALQGELREGWRSVMVEQFHFQPRSAQGYLTGGEPMNLNSGPVEVIPTPGHTPGHVSLFFREPAVLYLGDYDLSPFGPWYGDPGSDIDQTVASIERLRTVPAKVWIAAHETGVRTSAPADLWDRYLRIIDQREEKLLDRLQTPQRLDQIVDAWIVYGKPRQPQAFYAFGEAGHMKKHLARLMAQGRVGMEKETYFLI